MSKSFYDSNADKAERQLKVISDTMCYAKWAQVSLHLTNGRTHSCYHPPTHQIPVELLRENPSALHNTPAKKEERRLMLKGERPKGCEYCWKIEDIGGRSDRIYRSGEPWAQNAINDIQAAQDTGNITPRYVEVNFNQACNFKCSYCSPHLSSTWHDEIKKHGPYKVENGEHNNLFYLERDGMMPLKVSNLDNPYVNAFWDWWPELYKTLEVFRMTGGEPLMDKNTFKVLDYINEHPNSDLELSITSNMCPPQEELLDKFINKVQKIEEIHIWKDEEKFNPSSGNHWYVQPACKNMTVFVSLDSVGKDAEYIRNGMNFTYLQDNIQRLLTQTNQVNVTFINTFNIFSLPNFKGFLQYILDLREQFSKDNQGVKHIPIYDPTHKHPDFVLQPRQRIGFDIPLLRYPQWQCIQILPEEYEHYLIEAVEFMKQNRSDEVKQDFRGFRDFEIAKAERNLEWMRERKHLSNQVLIEAKKNFINFFVQHDERRGTRLLEVFPSLENFWNDCIIHSTINIL
jgi:organic radical activating enzyme